MDEIKPCEFRANSSCRERTQLSEKEGQRLIIEAAPPRSLLAVLATLQTLDENFPPIEDPPAEPVDL